MQYCVLIFNHIYFDVVLDMGIRKIQKSTTTQQGGQIMRIKRLLIGMLTAVTMLTATVAPAFAAEEHSDSSTEFLNESDSVVTRAGNETWTGSGHGGSYTFTNNNLTPVKTMGKSGRLLISGYFYGNDGYASSHPIILTVQIRSTSGAVLGSTQVYDTRNGNVEFAVSANVSAGQQIQLFFDASSAGSSPGIYRSAYVNYGYDLY